VKTWLRRKTAWERWQQLVRRYDERPLRTNDMGSDQVNPEAGKMDYPAHQRNYSGFIRLLKISTILTVIISAAVILLIAN
jgi:hypothetical protein